MSIKDWFKKNEMHVKYGEDIHYEFVYIPSGSFMMGAYHGEADERPIHNVMINAFYLGQYVVTQKQWFEVMETKPWQDMKFVKEGNNYPAVNVSWYEVLDMIKKLNKTSGKNYRLPSEAEWEYACSAGRKSAYSFRRFKMGLSRSAWYYDNAFKKNERYPHQVGLKQPNKWGLFDMLGNVNEWCSDWYAADYYHNSPLMNPQGPSYGEYRVIRGGDWARTAYFLRWSARGYYSPHSKDCCLGFRLAMDADDS